MSRLEVFPQSDLPKRLEVALGASEPLFMKMNSSYMHRQTTFAGCRKGAFRTAERFQLPVDGPDMIIQSVFSDRRKTAI